VSALVTGAPGGSGVSSRAPADLGELRRHLAALDRVVVAFSGGADSAFLARVAHEVLGPDRAVAVTAVSPSLARDEHDDCAALAAEWNLTWRPVITDEMANAAYRRNGGDRCFWCKDALMDVLVPLVGAGGDHAGATVVLGVNADDLGDHRPGQSAAAARGARFPLVEAGFTKADVREHSRRLGLRTWDKPAAACLASRLPYGTPVSVRVLSRIDRAEAALRRLGFTALRVRHYGDTARIEVPTDEIAVLVTRREAVVEAVRAAGYRYVTVDLEGLRSGNLNAALTARPPSG
jgi:pyridinium-3,5-biscarboxylic acid mononucleotide sulfurtransferase